MAMPSSSTHLSGTETADRSEYEDDALPEFVFPLFLTSKTQEIFGCKVDEDVTSDSTFKLIPKEDILQDYKNRAAISDFHPAKSIIQVTAFPRITCFSTLFCALKTTYMIFTIHMG